jgi:hypothetical protein
MTRCASTLVALEIRPWHRAGPPHGDLDLALTPPCRQWRNCQIVRRWPTAQMVEPVNQDLNEVLP